ncbi:hypothetical protein RUND412_006263 [Rhizina undulata]
MASRRLVDLIALVNASTSIAQKHLLIRSHQLNVYTSTSTVCKVFRSSRPIQPSTPAVAKHASTPSPPFDQASSSPASETPNPRKTPPPEEAKRLQYESESPIPSVVAEAPSTAPENHDETVNNQEYMPSEKLTQGLNEEVFYLRHARASPVLSNLPRMKIPRNPEGEQVVSGIGVNADVFYERPGEPKTAATEEKTEEEEKEKEEAEEKSEMLENQLSGGFEGLNHGIFQSRGGRKLVEDGISERREAREKMIKIPENVVRQTEELKEAEVEAEVDEILRKAIEGPDAVAQQSPAKQAFQMTASRVPSSRIGRLFHYGGLAAGMAWGAAGEGIRRVTGGVSESNNGSLMFTPANVERLVKKLSRMRGAALKLGQMMSFQDSKMLPAPIHEILSRVQDSADYMPASQRNSVLTANLGKNWRDLFSEFEEAPMAAASIGQVHAATLASTGMPIAVKIQYPGVADSISSDLNNLAVLLTASKLLPKGLYLEKTIANARTELGWECDYIREAECAKKFAELLQYDTHVFRVPKVIDEACGPQVLTMERMWGVGVTKLVKDLSQDERDFIGGQILRLCFREVREFAFMQTDPNWTNFLWNKADGKIELLDFGASRAYDKPFIDAYCFLLQAAARGDRDACKEFSLQLGYLTGLETESMLNAHITSILTLAEPFANNAAEVYDFSNQTVTDRVRGLIPLMMRERLTPPPEETYSLHRKLSGAFLLCARLGSRVRCRDIFAEVLGG